MKTDPNPGTDAAVFAVLVIIVVAVVATASYLEPGRSSATGASSTGTETAFPTIPVGSGPSYIVSCSASGQLLCVVNSNNATVSVLSASDNSVVGTADLGTPYAANQTTGIVSLFAVYVPSNGDLYVLSMHPAGNQTGVVSVVDVSAENCCALAATISAGNGIGSYLSPEKMGYDPATNQVFVVNLLNDTVSVISASTNSLTGTIQVGSQPVAVAFSSSGAAYVSDVGNDSLSVIPTSGAASTIPLPGADYPYYMSYDPANGYLYVGDESMNVSVVDTATNQLAQTLPLPSYPYTIGYNPRSGTMVVCEEEGMVTFINTTSNAVLTTVTLSYSQDPNYVVYSPASGRSYVMGGTYSISVFEFIGTTLTQTVPVGNTPLTAAYSPFNGMMYVVNYYGDTVSVIP